MNRGIKFRGICIDDEIFKYGYLVKNGIRCFIFSGELKTDGVCHVWDRSEVFPETVGQLTPKQDLNGDDIYEDDYLKYNNHEYGDPAHDIPYLVLFDENTADFDSENSMNFMSPTVWDNMEIIGNKHQNPELKESE